MRISDWSSDVCSSDLLRQIGEVRIAGAEIVHRDGAADLLQGVHRARDPIGIGDERAFGEFEREAIARQPARFDHALDDGRDIVALELDRRQVDRDAYPAIAAGARIPFHERRRRLVERPAPRSEEHTSELQSLMRISYAV